MVSRNYVSLEHILFPLPIPLYFFKKSIPSSNKFKDSTWILQSLQHCSQTKTRIRKKQNKYLKTRSKFNSWVTLTSRSSYDISIEANHRLKGVNDLQCRPATKTTNSCTDNPLNKQAWVFLITFEHGILEHIHSLHRFRGIPVRL